MTAVATQRPIAPRRAITLIPALAVMTVIMAVVGVVAGALDGVLWGVLLAAGLIIGLMVSGERPTTTEMAAVGIAMAGAGWLTLVLMEEGAELLTPWGSAQLAAVWLVAGAVVAWAVGRQRSEANRPSLIAMWALAGAALMPLTSILNQLEYDDGGLKAGAFVVSGIALAMIGGSASLTAITGVRAVAVAGGTLILTWFAGAQVGFTLTGLIENIGNMSNIPDFWPPNFAWAIGDGVWWNPVSWDFGSPNLPNPLVETFRIGILSSVLGCLVALPVAFMASSVTAPNRITYYMDKGFMNVIRTIPDLFWAMLFVTGVGVGPFAGVLALFFFSLAIMGKLLSETVDSVDTGPLEAAKATGSTHFPAVRASVLPDVLPNYVAYALYVFEINIRASVVIGLVGAGGIGRVIEAQRVFFRFDRVFAIVIVMLIIVFLIEQVSVYFRRKLV